MQKKSWSTYSNKNLCRNVSTLQMLNSDWLGLYRGVLYMSHKYSRVLYQTWTTSIFKKDLHVTWQPNEISISKSMI